MYSTDRQRSLQFALLVAFSIQGFLAATQIPRVPDIIDQIGVTFTQWGTIVGFLALGSATGLFVANRLIERFGGNVVAIVAFVVFAALTGSIGFMHNPVVYFISAFLVAFIMSCYNLAINAQAVLAQQMAGKVIIGRFHAAWSIGAATAAAVSGALTPILDIRVHFVAFAGFSLVVFLLWGSKLLNRDEARTADANSDSPTVSWFHMPKRVYLLAAGLLCAVFPEAVMIDWSAILIRDGLSVPVSLRAIPYATFAAAMIVGRLLIGRITARMSFGRLAVVGSAASAVSGAASLIVAPALIVSDPVLGVVVLSALWAVAGLGTAALVPSYFSATNTVPHMTTGVVMSRIIILEMGIMTVAKIVMGASAEDWGITTAYWGVIIAWVVTSVIAGYVGRLSPHVSESTKEAEHA